MNTPVRGATLDTAQTVSTYLLREPVKQAVKEAIHEETASVKPADSRSGTSSSGSGSSSGSRSDATADTGSDSDDGGRSKLSVGAMLLVVGGLAYFARRRLNSGGDSSGPGEQRGDFERASPGSTGDVGGSTATVSDEG